MTAYYNENDPKAAAWLRELIAAGLIAPGDVDERSIEDVTPGEVQGYTQCHWFAGIGGWSYALRLAGWPDDQSVWTGSCPCQPFSAAGARRGVDDPRHLWPVWRWLIDQCRPATVFGEQVASKAGRGWLAGVRTDLEAMGYGVGAADLCAASVGAPHIRQRLFWAANAKLPERRAQRGACSGVAGEHALQRRGQEDSNRLAVRGAGSQGLSERERDGRLQSKAGRALEGQAAELSGHYCGLLDTDSGRRRQAGYSEPGSDSEAVCGQAAGRLGNHGPWDDYVWIPCADGKARRLEPGLEPLAHGVSGRVAQLRGLGNAIVAQVAAAFIEAYRDAL